MSKITYSYNLITFEKYYRGSQIQGLIR